MLNKPNKVWKIKYMECFYIEKFAIHTEKSNKMQQCIKIYYSIFIWNSTCFERHTAHHQEPKTALAASGLHMWKVVGRVVAARFQALLDSVQQQAIKIYYSIFTWNSTCFGRHTAHHQEPKTALAASGLHMWKVVGRVVAGRCQAEPDSLQQPHIQQPSTYANQRLLVQFWVPDDGRCVPRNMLSFI